MTDVNKRQTLKTLGVSAIAVGSLPAAALAVTAESDLSLEVHYSAAGNTDSLVMHNPGNRDLTVALDFSGDIAVPGGHLDISKVMQSGPISVGAGETRRFEMARIEQGDRDVVSTAINGHHALRFPISDNVFVDNISVSADQPLRRKQIPLLLKRVV